MAILLGVFFFNLFIYSAAAEVLPHIRCSLGYSIDQVMGHVVNGDIPFTYEQSAKTNIAEGSEGKVFRVEYRDCILAMKCPHENVDLQGEFDTLNIFQNIPNVHVVESYFMTTPALGAKPCMIMKYYEVNLFNANLVETYAEDLDMLPQLILQLVDTMAYIHGKDYILNDFKPDNILFSREENRLVIADFGGVKLMEQEGMHSLYYSSAEREKGTSHDVFSLGQVMKIVYGMPKAVLEAEFVQQITLQFDPDRARDLLSSEQYANLQDKLKLYQFLNPLPKEFELPHAPEPIHQLIRGCIEFLPIKRPAVPVIQQSLHAIINHDSLSRISIFEPPLSPLSNCSDLQDELELLGNERTLTHLDIGGFKGMLKGIHANDGVFKGNVYGCVVSVYVTDHPFDLTTNMAARHPEMILPLRNGPVVQQLKLTKDLTLAEQRTQVILYQN